jgi:hypothetical protein
MTGASLIVSGRVPKITATVCFCTLGSMDDRNEIYQNPPQH